MKKLFGMVLPVLLAVLFATGGGLLLVHTISTPREVVYREVTAPATQMARTSGKEGKYQFNQKSAEDIDDTYKVSGKSSDISDLEDLIDSINEETNITTDENP